MTGLTGYILLLSMELVSRGLCYLYPLGVTTVMTLFTSIVRNMGVGCVDVGALQQVIYHQPGTCYRAGMMTTVATDLAVFTLFPLVIGHIHRVA